MLSEAEVFALRRQYGGAGANVSVALSNVALRDARGDGPYTRALAARRGTPVPTDWQYREQRPGDSAETVDHGASAQAEGATAMTTPPPVPHALGSQGEIAGKTAGAAAMTTLTTALTAADALAEMEARMTALREQWLDTQSPRHRAALVDQQRQVQANMYDLHVADQGLQNWLPRQAKWLEHQTHVLGLVTDYERTLAAIPPGDADWQAATNRLAYRALLEHWRGARHGRVPVPGRRRCDAQAVRQHLLPLPLVQRRLAEAQRTVADLTQKLDAALAAWRAERDKVVV